MDISYNKRAIVKGDFITPEEFKKLQEEASKIETGTKKPKKAKKETQTREKKKKITYSKSGIYAIICEKLKKVYVGQSKNIEGRIKHHRSSLKKNSYRENMALLQSDFNRLGENHFEFKIVDEVEEHVLLRWETYYIDYYSKQGYSLYNKVLDTENSTSILSINPKYLKVMQRIVNLLDRGTITIEMIEQGIGSWE